MKRIILFILLNIKIVIISAQSANVERQMLLYPEFIKIDNGCYTYQDSIISVRDSLIFDCNALCLNCDKITQEDTLMLALYSQTFHSTYNQPILYNKKNDYWRAFVCTNDFQYMISLLLDGDIIKYKMLKSDAKGPLDGKIIFQKEIILSEKQSKSITQKLKAIAKRNIKKELNMNSNYSYAFVEYMINDKSNTYYLTNVNDKFYKTELKLLKKLILYCQKNN